MALPNISSIRSGPQGPVWGTKLTDIEAIAVAIREVLAERMLQQTLQPQADTAAERPTEYQGCPGCKRTTQAEDPEPRLVTTRAGEAEWQEPHE